MFDRKFQLIRAGENGYTLEVMIYGGSLRDMRTLLIFHSIEFPLPPTSLFCDAMWKAGLQVVFVRRSGFGSSSPLPRPLVEKTPITNGATAMAEAAMLHKLIATLSLSDVVVLAMGSSNPIIYRLVHLAPQISYSIFANPMFNQDIWQVFSPDWFQAMLKQIVASQSGLKVAIQGMKMLIRRDPISFYTHIYQKNEYDLAYVEENAADYRKAGELTLDIDPAQLYYDTMMCLSDDPMLKDGFFRNIPGTVLIGEKSSEHWRMQMASEAARVGLPVVEAPKGDLFCAYASPDTLLSILERHEESALLEAG